MSLSYDGPFGFVANLSFNVGKENVGKYVNLYYYNEQDGDLEYQNSGTVDKDGNTTLSFSHASEYVAIIDEVSNIELPAGSEAAVNGGFNFIYLICIAIILVAAIVGGTLVWQKKKDN